MYFSTVFTGRNEVVAKVIFLHLSVILFTGGVSSRENLPAWRTPPSSENPPCQGEPPPTRENPPGPDPPGPEPPPGPDPPSPPGSRLQHTVNERPVRILLECILVHTEFTHLSIYLDYNFGPFDNN